MGVFQFTWPYQAGQVFVTGTFDSWKGSVELQRDSESGLFTAFVELGETEKVFYKYIVDGNWTVNYEAKKEYDQSGNENNVLYPEDLRTPTPSIKEKGITILPGEPESGMDTPPMQSPDMDDVPGGFPETPAAEEKEILSVTPLPASVTAGNPITLQPGEPVPEIIPQSADDTVHLDKESYEKADASNFGISSEPPFLPPVVTPADEREANGTGVLDVPEITSPVEEEEKLPEPQAKDEEIPAASVPEIVKESQAIAHASPEASADEALVEKKTELEQELVSEPPQLQHIEVEEVKPLVTETAPVAEATIEPPVTNPRSVSPTMSPLTTPAAPTTHVSTCSVPGATFTNMAEPAPSTRSSSASSRDSHNEKIDILKDRNPEKKKEKRRSLILGRILNLFK